MTKHTHNDTYTMPRAIVSNKTETRRTMHTATQTQTTTIIRNHCRHYNCTMPPHTAHKCHATCIVPQTNWRVWAHVTRTGCTFMCCVYVSNDSNERTNDTKQHDWLHGITYILYKPQSIRASIIDAFHTQRERPWRILIPGAQSTAHPSLIQRHANLRRRDMKMRRIGDGGDAHSTTATMCTRSFCHVCVADCVICDCNSDTANSTEPDLDSATKSGKFKCDYWAYYIAVV